MNQKQAKKYLSELKLEDQALFLAYLSHELTIANRFYYSGTDAESPDRVIAALKGINEIQHRVSAQLGSILSSDHEGQFPTDALIDVLFFWAEAYDNEPVIAHLMQALDRSASYLRAPAGQPKRPG